MPRKAVPADASDLPEPRKVDINAVCSGVKYRKNLGDLTPLADSILRHGQRQPLVVLAGSMELLAGERRLAAMRSLALTEVDVLIVSGVEQVTQALKADRLSANDSDGVVKSIAPSELVMQGEVLHRFVNRGARNSLYVDVVMVVTNAASWTGLGTTAYRAIRFLCLISHGRRVESNEPVSTLERRIARDALDQIDAGRSPLPIVKLTRAKLGYPPGRRRPTMSVDLNRMPDTHTVKTLTRRATPQASALDRFENAVSRMLIALATVERVATEARFRRQQVKVAPATRNDLTQAVQRLTALTSQLANPNLGASPTITKESTR